MKSTKNTIALLMALFLLFSSISTVIATQTPVLGTLVENSTVSLKVEDTVYELSIINIGKDENGKTTVTISGMGGIVFIRNGQMIVPILMKMVCGEESYQATDVSISPEESIYFFDTDKEPDSIFVFAYDKPDVQVEMIIPNK